MGKCIQDYVDRETTARRMRVEDAETVFKQKQEDKRNAEEVGLTTTKPETTFEEMLNAIGDSLSDLASSHHGEDGTDKDDNDDDLELRKLSEGDEPGWVMGTISKRVQRRMEWLWQKQMMVDELMQPAWGDSADYFCQRDKMLGTTKVQVPAVVQLQTEADGASSATTTFRDPMETLDSIRRKSEMWQVTSRPGSSHMSLGSKKPQTQKQILSLPPDATPNMSFIKKWQPVVPGSVYASI